MKDIFDEIYTKEEGYGAGSSHAITGYKVRDGLFVTIWHEDYVPQSIDVYFREGDDMIPVDDKLTIDIDWVAGTVHSEVPGIDNFQDCMRLCYIARCGEVVRDDC